MSYDLRIMFSGLAMYVHEEKKDLMHVLLPDASSHAHGAGTHGAHGGVHGHDGGAALLDPPAKTGARSWATDEEETEDAAAPDADSAIEQHFTRIIYDAAYEDPTATQLSRKYVIRDFQGSSLDLRGLATTSRSIRACRTRSRSSTKWPRRWTPSW